MLLYDAMPLHLSKKLNPQMEGIASASPTTSRLDRSGGEQQLVTR
jgi:hypothetical protein